MLNAFTNEPFGIATQVDLNDYFTGDGSTNGPYQLVNKTGIQMGSVVQGGSYQYFKSNLGVSVNNSLNQFSVSSPTPSAGAVIIAPGIIRFTFKAYGQASIYGGYSSPNVSQTPIYFANIDDITTKQYIPSLGQTDILIMLVDKDPTVGIDATCFQFAPMNPDGTPGSYGAAGAPFNTTSIEAYDTLQSGVSSLATMITVANGSQFTNGRYIYIDAGTGFQDQVRITNISGNILTTTPTTYAHSSGAGVFENGFGMYVKLTLPTTFTDVHNYYDCVIEDVFDEIDRT